MCRALKMLTPVPWFAAATALRLTHGWGKVKDMMGAHAAYGHEDPIPDADVAFAASAYATITLGGGCVPGNVTASNSMETSVLALATRLKAKAATPIRVGMYWRSDFALEMATCSRYTPAWNAHPEFWLRMDNGSYAMRGADHYIDHTNPAARQFFATAVANVTRATLPSGEPVLDYLFIDGDPTNTQGWPGLGPVRQKALFKGYYETFALIQQRLKHGQGVILNGLDDAESAKSHVSTGCTGGMFDHWTILQFLDRRTGAFDVPAMAAVRWPPPADAAHT